MEARDNCGVLDINATKKVCLRNAAILLIMDTKTLKMSRKCIKNY